MKGFYFQRPFEYHLVAEGEEWEQGGRICGTIRVKNTESEKVDSNSLQIGLAYGNFKKIKDREDDAWKEIQTEVLAESLNFAPEEEREFEWGFFLASDCPITDKSGSLFLLYGDGDLYSQGRIDVRMNLMPILQSFLQTFETQFRFQKKYEKSNLEFTEVKLVPPDSKDFPTLDHVLCYLRIHEEKMEIRYSFKMKSLGVKGDKSSLKVARKKREYQQQFTQEQYAQGGFPNRDFFRQSIQEAIEIAKPDVLF
ncbi:MAG: hypothetical protein HQM13_17590 [SAR324 cluster bacterium]|nr:hypothetical protein [SAR324 cluster bacterium]